MKKNQYLLLKLMEECAEISHVASKQIQFGKNSDNNGKYEKTNGQRLREEIIDLLVVASLLEDEGEFEQIPDDGSLAQNYQTKVAKMQKYVDASTKLGLIPEIKL